MTTPTMPTGHVPDIPTPPETRDRALTAYLYTLREQILFLSNKVEKLAAQIAEQEE